MESISVECPICKEKSEINMISKGQTVHRCKACKNLVKIVECEKKESKKAEKEEKPKKKKKTSSKKKPAKRKKKADEK